MTMLLSCPFCGGREQARADADDTWWLVCRDCGACGPVQHRGGDKFTWNTRALSQPGAGDAARDKLVAEVIAAHKALRKIPAEASWKIERDGYDRVFSALDVLIAHQAAQEKSNEADE